MGEERDAFGPIYNLNRATEEHGDRPRDQSADQTRFRWFGWLVLVGLGWALVLLGMRGAGRCDSEFLFPSFGRCSSWIFVGFGTIILLAALIGLVVVVSRDTFRATGKMRARRKSR